MSNQMFSQMNLAALARLEGRDPREIACNADVCYDEEKRFFRIPTMGMAVTVSYPDYHFSPELPGWHRLVTLHYLDLADGFPLTKNGEEAASSFSLRIFGRYLFQKTVRIAVVCNRTQMHKRFVNTEKVW